MLVRALEFPTFPDWNRECRSASVVGQAVPPARPRLTNPAAPRMPPTQPTPDRRNNWFACRAVQDFNQRMMAGTGILGKIDRCT